MAYKFAVQREVTELHKWCFGILLKVQEKLNNYFTFDIRLIGSGDKRLVTKDSNDCFDLDYNLILQRDKQDLIDNPKKIKELFINAFNSILNNALENYTHVCDSTSVITVKIIDQNIRKFSFDVAILVEGNDGFFYRLTNDKKTGRYIWNQVPSSKNYFKKFQEIKRQGYWEDFKKKYLKLKNLHENDHNVKSFSVFLETLNQFYQ